MVLVPYKVPHWVTSLTNRTCKILPHRFITNAKFFYTGSSYMHNSSTPVHHTCTILLHRFITHAKFFYTCSSHAQFFYTGSSHIQNLSTPVHHTCTILLHRFIIHAKLFYTGSSYMQNSSTSVQNPSHKSQTNRWVDPSSGCSTDNNKWYLIN